MSIEYVVSGYVDEGYFVALHLRTQIREAVASALTGLTTTGSNVFQSRVYNLKESDLPALLIKTETESVSVASAMAPRRLARRLRLVVVGVAKGTADVDDTLDQICKEVEVALAMPCLALAGLVKSITLSDVDISLSGDVDQPVGQAEMTYEVVYYTDEDEPDVAR